MSPLIRPDEEQHEEPPATIDTQVRETTENFWSVLRTVVGKAANARKLTKSPLVRKGFQAIWYSDKKKKR